MIKLIPQFSDGQLVLVEDSLTPDQAEEACLKLGGSLALLSTPYMREYAKNILVYYDYDMAWTSSPAGQGNESSSFRAF